MVALRERSVRLTGYLEALLDGMIADRPLRVITPAGPRAPRRPALGADRGGIGAGGVRSPAPRARRDRRRARARRRPARARAAVLHPPRRVAGGDGAGRRWSVPRLRHASRDRRRRAGRVPAGDAVGAARPRRRRLRAPRRTPGGRAPSAAARSTSRSPPAAWTRSAGSGSTSARSPTRCRCAGRTLHSRAGTLAYQSYSADGTRAINSISRAGLNHALLDRADAAPGVRLHFGHRLTGVDSDTGELTFEAATISRRADVVLGADGAYSAVRRSIQGGMDLHQDFLPARLQGADDPGAGRRVRAGPGVAAHLAARRVDDDRAAQHRPLVHLHAVLGQGRERSPRSTRPSRCSRRSASATPTPCR